MKTASLYPQTLRSTPALATAAVLLCAAPLFAQQMGVAHPEDLNDNVAVQQPADHYVKPSHAAEEVAPATPATSMTYAPVYEAQPSPAQNPPAAIVAEARPEPMAPPRYAMPLGDNMQDGIVTDIPDTPNELVDGTILRARLLDTVSTLHTATGTRFSAQIVANVGHHGRVLIPAGSIIRGRVADIHGGKRIGGKALIRLQPEWVEMPDGSSVRIAADVVDLDNFADSHVNREGLILPNTHNGRTAAELGLTTVSAVVAGAMIGGGVGALVGAGVAAGVGTAWWLKREHQETLPEGTQVVFCLKRTLRLNAAPGGSAEAPLAR